MTKRGLAEACEVPESSIYNYVEELSLFFDRGLLFYGLDPDSLKAMKKNLPPTASLSHDQITVIKAGAMARFKDDQLAKLLGIAESTWKEYKKSPRVKKAIIEGSEEATKDVIDALYQRATGKIKLTKEKVVSFMGNASIIPIKEDLPPDMQAIKLWLINHTNWDTADQPASVNLDDIKTEFDVREGFYHEETDL